jgi:phosphoribosylaminoimidazole carboxylase (NCAIR synthetase)
MYSQFESRLETILEYKPRPLTREINAAMISIIGDDNG